MQARLMIVLAIALLLAGCPGPQPRPTDDPRDPIAAADRLVDLGRDAEAAQLLARAADRHTGADAARFRVMAAELWLLADEPALARAQLARVDLHLLDDEDTLRAQLINAELALLDDRPGDALVRLPRDPESLPRGFATETLRIRAAAFQALGQYRDAVADLVMRDTLLRDRADITRNQELIWQALRRTEVDDEVEDEPVLAGWLALAGLRQLAWQDPARFEQALAAWRAAYPGHPAAARFLPRLVQEQRRVATGVDGIAVILPLTGRFAAAAGAVRDGLLAAHYHGGDPARRPRVSFYDTGDDPEAAVARYHEAVLDGADFVIGPLQKEALEALARLPDLPVPVLSLNTLDHGDAPQGMFQFGLVPEEEAAQIAERVVREGLEHGLALVPDNDLGIRMLQAFRARYEELGGTLLAIELYDPAQTDHSGPIIRALAINESRARQAALRTVLGVNLQVEPRRRRDAGFIFVVAVPQQGRALRPQLRFHHASDLPVYASSHLFTGIADSRQDADMNGVAFTDMPWTIAPDPATAGVQAELRRHLGGAFERNTRLFALGYDAYRLVPVLYHDPSLLADPVPAATGALHLTEDGRVYRTLSWALFQGGVPRPLRATPER